MDMKILQDPKFIIISILTLIIAVISIIKFHTILAGIICIGLALITIKICYDSITSSQTNTEVDDIEKPQNDSTLQERQKTSELHIASRVEKFNHSGVKDTSIRNYALNNKDSESDSDSVTGTEHIKNLDDEFSKVEAVAAKKAQISNLPELTINSLSKPTATPAQDGK